MSDEVDVLSGELFANHLTEDFGPLFDRSARRHSADHDLDAHRLQRFFDSDPVREPKGFDGGGTDIVET